MSNLPDETFRDTIGTIDEEGNRKFIFPKKPAGKFYEYRKWVSYFLLLVLVANPFIKIKQVKFFIRTMQVIAVQSKTHKHNF